MSVSVSPAASLASLPETERVAFLESLTRDELLALEHDWRFWARPNQLAPAGDWTTWLLLAGRGFGKTRSGAEFINHSCSPNLIARVRRGRVTLVSLRRIAVGEELLVDYQITGDGPWLECRCGSPACRGFMNRPPG